MNEILCCLDDSIVNSMRNAFADKLHVLNGRKENGETDLTAIDAILCWLQNTFGRKGAGEIRQEFLELFPSKGGKNNSLREAADTYNLIRHHIFPANRTVEQIESLLVVVILNIPDDLLRNIEIAGNFTAECPPWEERN
mmetsp:Transcript_9463/g.23765  ORF Transcript_9463/g.23765 Transcript_9463/m.23765 type:complete len:139 (-) Transcript_9463:403-819(-)